MLEVRKSLAELRDGLKRIRQELTDFFSDVEQTDRYGKQMWTFVGRATSQLEDIVDDVNHADSVFDEVVKYYGEDERNMSSSEFYGIFKTFVTSYKVRCKSVMYNGRLIPPLTSRNVRAKTRALLMSGWLLRNGSKLP